MKSVKIIVFYCALVFMLCSCDSTPKINDVYSKSQTAVDMLKEAIEILDMCIDGTLSPEECEEQLEIVASKGENVDEIADLVSLSISIQASLIENACLQERLGSATIVDVKETVQESRQKLWDRLYE